jgi:hypothetical protein
MCIALLLWLAFPALAQESASYRLTEHAINAGGDPSEGVVLTSASYKITLDAIGDGVVLSGMSSASYHADSGFVPAYVPPGEVHGLQFADAQTLAWNPEPSVGVYNLYRGLVHTLDGAVYGSCEEPGIGTNTTTDADPVPAGDGHYYLVTAENRLREEGILGRDSAGSTRPNTSPCP